MADADQKVVTMADADQKVVTMADADQKVVTLSDDAALKKSQRQSSRALAHQMASSKSMVGTSRKNLAAEAGATQLFTSTPPGGTPRRAGTSRKNLAAEVGATQLFTPTPPGGTPRRAVSSVQRSPSTKSVKADADAEGSQGSPVGSPGRSSSYLGRSRHAARPWKPQTTAHPTPLEQREPQGWTLSHILSKVKVGVQMSKAFQAHLYCGDPNAGSTVKVGVRFRPLSELEKRRNEGEKSKEFIKTSGVQVKLINPRPPPGQEAKADEYAFDALYNPEDTTAKVFKDLAAPLVHLLVEGFNGTIFAYGQTGSGKTHSMMGNSSDPGITPRVVTELFDVLGKLEGKVTWEVRASYLQIYREVLHDLLAGGDVNTARDAGRDRGYDLKIRRDPERGIYVQNLSEEVLTSGAGLAAMIEQGNKRRATAATLMNAESSRSHAVVILHLERHDAATAKRKARKLTAKLNLVDLAGSERVVKSGATGETLKEAIAINQSLSMLGTVINALTDVRSGTHIPYRSSKLTYLLEESLGGNSHTVMLATASPSSRSYFETSSTLQYAVRAKMIVTNPKANYDIDKESKDDEEEDAYKSRAPEFHYLPRYVRSHDKGANTDRPVILGPATVPKSARL